MVDLDGDGRYELVVDDPTWALQLRTDGSNGIPHMPLVVARSAGRFVHACRQFAGVFLTAIRQDRWEGRGADSAQAQTVASASAAFFAYLQIGAFEEARAQLDRIETTMGLFLHNELSPARTTPGYPTARQVREDHEDVLEAARRYAGAGCPGSAPAMPSGRNAVLRRAHRERAE